MDENDKRAAKAEYLRQWRANNPGYQKAWEEKNKARAKEISRAASKRHLAKKRRERKLVVLQTILEEFAAEGHQWAISALVLVKQQ